VARPKKIGLEYFPVDVDFDEKIDALEMLHGNNGLTWVIKFWQGAYKTETGEINLDGLFGELFANKCRITIEEHNKILESAIKVEFCFKSETGLYTSNGIKKRISAVSKERSDAIKRQEERKSKVKKSKVNETPRYSMNNLTVFKPPEKQEVIDYFREYGYSESLAIRFFTGYSEANPTWTDRQGNHIKSWKTKAQQVWFRDENKSDQKSDDDRFKFLEGK
jgi:hypothetical protein